MNKLLISIFILINLASYGQQQSNITLLNKRQLKGVKIYCDIDDAMREPEKVIILDLTGKRLDSLPESIGQLINLQVLKLGCKINDSVPKRIIRKSRRIGGGIMHLDRGTGRFIKYNYITKLPDSIKFLTKLQEINLSNNRLKEVPFELAKLKQLKLVNLNVNYALLDKVDDLKKLKSMLPSDCNLVTGMEID